MKRRSDKWLISILLNKPGTLPSAYMSTLGACMGHTLMTDFTALCSCLTEWTEGILYITSAPPSDKKLLITSASISNSRKCHSLSVYYSRKGRARGVATKWWHILSLAGVGPLPQLDQTIFPINIMRMNQRVVLFLMVCNGTSADRVIAPSLLTFLITQWQRPCPTTIFNRRMGNHLRPILLDSL